MQAGYKKSGSSHSLIIDASRITRVIKGIYIITPQGKAVLLKDLFPSKRDLVKKHIKVIIDKEKEDICNRRVEKPYTDEELRRKLNYASVTRREIAYCRKDMGILPYSKRLNSYGYPSLSANFSKIHPFTVTSVKNNTPACPGVYELRLAEGMIEYPVGVCQTFYIGSAKNLRKRLRDHLGANGKNGGIKKFLEKNRCVFRYIQFSPVGRTGSPESGWVREEKSLYDLFMTTFGDSPVCNHVSPKACES
jgi:RNA polymerase sigma-54 factor